MANMLQNMLTLQTEYKIPMRMDLNTNSLLNYYENQKTFESPKILDEVISDLRQKAATEYAAYIKTMKNEDGLNSQWYE